MKSVEQLKKETAETIEEKLKKENDRVNAEKDLILQSNSLPEILIALVNIYGNTIEQGKLQASFIKEMTSAPFFKEASCSVKTNHIVFEDKTYEIVFPKSFSRTITVKRHLEHFVPRKPNINEETILISDSYLKQKESGNVKYKSFVDLYLTKIANKKPNILNRMMVREKNVENMLESLLKIKENYDKIYSNWFEEMEELKKAKEVDLKFIKSIEKDLNEFRENDWNLDIRLENHQMNIALQKLFE